MFLSASLILSTALTASITFDSGLDIQKYVIEDNGLTVILAEDHTLPVVAVNVWYNAGPINEPPKRSGFAHLFEHLMFQGSKYVGDDMHFKHLEAVGASAINGTTGNDRTNYFETVPANQLELALWLESDRMGFLKESLSQEKLDNQRDVVMNERRQRIDNVPYGPSSEKLIQTVFTEDHPYYGYVIGSMEHLQAATLEDVHNFYERYYAPSNATLVVAGDFDPQTIRTLVTKYFGTLPKRSAPDVVEVQPASITAERRVTVEEPVPLPQIQLGWLSPAFFQSGDAECDILAYILGAGKSSRLYQKLVYELQLAQNVSAGQRSSKLGSLFTITVTGRPGVDVAELEKQIQNVIDEAQQAPPTKHEVERARNLILTGALASLQRIGRLADALNRYQHYVGQPDYFQQDLKRYDSVDPQAVHAIAKKVLDSNQRAVVITVPKS